jgi:cytochrome P450
VTHRHPALWQEPDRFDPRRFIPERAATGPALAFFPFGDGPRSCIGAHFSYVQMELILAMLARRFEWRPLPGHDVGLMASATMRPRNGVPISVARLTPRPEGLDAWWRREAERRRQPREGSAMRRK